MDERAFIREKYGLSSWYVFDDDLASLSEDIIKRTRVLCVQTHFDMTREDYRAFLDQFRKHAPGMRIVHFDWTANADLRLAETVEADIALYVKKHALRDHAQYGRPTLGATNLSDHFLKRFDIEFETSQFPVTPAFLQKMEIGPTFFAEYAMQRRFRRNRPDDWPDERPIDLHARIGVSGKGWYNAMRKEALACALSVSGERVLTDTPVPGKQYMAEMKTAQMCYSPFGYGEICWRDFEALSVGTLLLKPDVSHIETEPDFFKAGETYVALRWDSADLAEKVDYYRANPGEARDIAQNAFLQIKKYFEERAFEAHFDRVFGGL